MDFVDQAPRLTDFIKLWHVTKTSDDAVGKGDPVNEMLTRSLRGISSVEGLELTTTLNDNISNLFAREWNAHRLWLPTEETFDLPCYQKILIPEERRNQKRYLRKLINQLTDLDREYRANKLNLHHPEGESYKDDAAKAVMYSCYASVGLSTSPQPATYVTLNTQPASKKDEEQERLKELAREMEKPISAWNDL